MSRIRSIKPEFPQSESMGNVSREARLAFILLWTLADDAGRLRGNSRMLASLLFPYDDDAPGLIDGWLAELEHENCIVRYRVADASYVEIVNWQQHQKIDRPSASKLPPSSDGSRVVAKAREPSSLDRKGRDQGEEGSGEVVASPSAPPAKPEARASRLPSEWTLPPDWQAWAEAERPDLDPTLEAERFRDFWVAKPGKDGRKLDWQATWRNWIRNARAGPKGFAPAPAFDREAVLAKVFNEAQ